MIFIWYHLRIFFSKYIPGPYLIMFHLYAYDMTMFAIFVLSYFAITSDPGVINNKREVEIASKRYKFDNVLYFKEDMCKVCKWHKPARSNHCKVLNICVEKYDQYNFFLNNAIGRKNYRIYIIWVYVYFWFLIYGAILHIMVIIGQMEVRHR